MADNVVPDTFPFAWNEKTLENIARNAAPVRIDALKDSQKLSNVMKFVGMAHRLYIEADKYNTREEKINKLFERYEELHNRSPGLFYAAIDGTLYKGELGRRLAAFQKAQGDPEKIASNMEEIIQEDIAKAKENYEKYLNNYGGGQMQTQNQVDEIIAKHKQSKK